MSLFRRFFAAGPAKPRLDGKPPLSIRERFKAFSNLTQLLRLIWGTSRPLTIADFLLRIVKAAAPLALLYVGKLIINEIVALIGSSEPKNFAHLWFLVAAEFGIAVASDLLGRGIALIDSLLGDLFTNRTSLRIMEHAARLDLYHFEDSNFYDKLERARQQTTGRTTLMSQMFSQLQDLITMAILAAGLIAFNPWLIVLLFVALVPAFLGEAHFNARTYSFMRKWTPERRGLDTLRYARASDEKAAEVKIFDLSEFLTSRYRMLSDRFFETNKSLSVRRSVWGSFLAIIGGSGYYVAYVFIILRTGRGEASLGGLTFLARSFRQLQDLLQTVLSRFPAMAGGPPYLRALFAFFDRA